MADTHRFSVSVAAAVVRDDGRVLAIKRADNGHWEPPGGVLEPGETLIEALKREVLEETGFVVEPERLSGVYQNLQRDIVSVVYRCSVAGGAERASEESRRVEWLEEVQVRELMTEAYAVRLLDGMGDSNETPTRAHDGMDLVDPQ